MLDRELLGKIKALGISTDWNDAFAGKSKGNKHLFRVVKIAKHLARRLKADTRIVEAGAWLHDTALPSGDDYNYEKNKKIVKKILKPFLISAQELEAIAECVASHEGTSTIATLEAKIVHDADVLEKTGILGVIRHTWKLVHSGKLSPLNITEREVRDILEHLQWRSAKLQTSLGKRIGAYLSVVSMKRLAPVLIPAVAEIASRGVITEKIAVMINKKLNLHQRNRLREQLTLSYLRKF